MGYYVTLINSDFRIPENETVLNVLKDLNKRDDLKTGGEYIGGERRRSWFAWMPENYDETVKSVAEVFALLGFEADTESTDGEYVSLYGYDNKSGSEDVFLSAVAPFVADGSYIEWRGEEGEIWRNVVKNGTLEYVTATISWSN